MRIELDMRFDMPLYNVGEAARYLRLSPSTPRIQVDGYTKVRPGVAEVLGAPVVTAVRPEVTGGARLPFVGLAEAYVLNAFRRAGVPLQRIRPSLDWLKSEVGPHALASQHLFTDGAEVLWNHSQDVVDGEAVRRLIVPCSGQYVFRDVVEKYLRQVSFSTDGYANLIRLPHYGAAEVVVDPTRNFGHPIFARGGVAVESVLGRVRAGESIEDAAEDFGVPAAELSAAYLLRAQARPAVTALRFFTDRNLGNRIVSRILRGAGLDVLTMSEHYGEAAAQQVADVDQIGEPALLDRVAFHQEARIRRRPAEKAAVVASGAEMFCVVNGNLTGAQTAARYLDNFAAITAAAGQAGPFIYGVYKARIERLAL